jgi:hypothetical protein
VELLVAVVLGALILGSIYQVLVTNQRISAVQREQVLGQQTVRAGLDVLARELRELSAGAGDLVAMEADRVEFRASRAFGLACEVVNSTPPVLTVAIEGNAFQDGDDVFVFGDGNAQIASDDQWFSVTVDAAVAGETCGDDDVLAQELRLSGPLAQADANSIRRGAIVRQWESVEYELRAVDGGVFLVRISGGEAARLVGPLRPDDGLAFEYLDEDGNATAVAANVARIRITLRTFSAVRTEQGRVVADSLTTSVFLRN